MSNAAYLIPTGRWGGAPGSCSAHGSACPVRPDQRKHHGRDRGKRGRAMAGQPGGPGPIRPGKPGEGDQGNGNRTCLKTRSSRFPSRVEKRGPRPVCHGRTPSARDHPGGPWPNSSRSSGRAARSLPGNSSGMNDGAACVIVASREKARGNWALSPWSRSWDTPPWGVEPAVMGIGPHLRHSKGSGEDRIDS